MPPGRPKQFQECEALDAALDVFWDKGYESTSMSDLVEAMGIGRQSLYNCFGDKRQLFLAALTRYLDTRMTALIAKLESPGRAKEHLNDIFDVWLEQNTSGHRGCMFTNSLSEFGSEDADMRELHRHHLGRLAGALENAVRRGQAEGDVSAETDPRAVAHTLLALSQGVSTLGRGGADAVVIRDITQTAKRLIA